MMRSRKIGGRPRSGGSGRTALVLVVAMLLGACQQAPGPLFPEPEVDLVWPDLPTPARIRYVGELSTSEDLSPGRGAFEGLSDLLFGKDAPSGLAGPRAATLSRDGRWLWVTDPGSRRVHLLDLVDRTHLPIEMAGERPLTVPVGVCLGPEGTVLVCDSGDVSISRFKVDTGEWIDDLRLPVEVFRPVAVAWHEPSDSLFVVDSQAHDVKVLDLDGSLKSVIGRRGTGAGEFNFPCDLVLDGDRFWVADAGNQRVQALAFDGTPILSIGQAGDAPGDFALPKAIALDHDGNVYVVDGRFENVQAFDRTGRLLLAFGEEGTGPGQFCLPGGIHIDGTNRIWVCDTYNRRLQVFDCVSSAPLASGASAEPREEDRP